MAEEREKQGPSGDPEIDHQVSDMEHSSEELEDAIRETKREWEAKQSSEGVPGAVDSDADEPGP